MAKEKTQREIGYYSPFNRFFRKLLGIEEEGTKEYRGTGYDDPRYTGEEEPEEEKRQLQPGEYENVLDLYKDIFQTILGPKGKATGEPIIGEGVSQEGPLFEGLDPQQKALRDYSDEDVALRGMYPGVMAGGELGDVVTEEVSSPAIAALRKKLAEVLKQYSKQGTTPK
jgi:hypothetical protein